MNQPIVTVNCRKAGKSVDPRTIRRRLEKALNMLHRETATVSVTLCNDEFIHELNQTYRHVDRPTDVLSFAMQEGEALVGAENVLGDIVISVETAARQAPELKHKVTEEVTSLLIHGLLHLLGYDHQEEEDEKEMTDMANKILDAVLPRK